MANDYTRAERLWLWALAAIGLLGVNGVFLWSMIARPEALRDALSDPIALAFGVEALLLVAALAWLFRNQGLTRLGWGWFVALALVSSLAFAIPIALLFGGGSRVGGPPKSHHRPGGAG